MKKLFFLLLIICHLYANEPITLYTFFTASHAQFKDEWFLPTLKDDFPVIIKEFPQECPSGSYRSSGWTTTMMRKVDMILQAIEDHWGELIIYSDVDIQFFRPIKKAILKAINNYDIAFQQESPTGDIGAGFLILRANEQTYRLWQLIKKEMHNKPEKTDQLSLNYILHKTNLCKKLQWRLLPIQFFAGGTLTGTVWKPGNKLNLPKGIILHHANSTIGMKNKFSQLKYVKSKIKKNTVSNIKLNQKNK